MDIIVAVWAGSVGCIGTGRGRSPVIAVWMMSKLQGCWCGAGDGNAQQLPAWGLAVHRACEVGLTGYPYRIQNTIYMVDNDWSLT